MTETSSVQAEAVEISQPTEEHQWLEQWTHMLIGLSLFLILRTLFIPVLPSQLWFVNGVT